MHKMERSAELPYKKYIGETEVVVNMNVKL